MDGRAAAPWRPRPTNPTVPAKRSADTQEAEWVAKEDVFVLNQAKKKAEIRVREGRARPIDWLAVTLHAIDPNRDTRDDDPAAAELDVVDPGGVFEGLGDAQLADLEKDIDTYLALETSRDNRDYWEVGLQSLFWRDGADKAQTMRVICRDRRRATGAAAPEGRAVSSVSSDVDRLLAPKSFDELETLERQIVRKLDSNEPIDVDYWEQLLRSLGVWKAKARLKKVYQAAIDTRLKALRKQQQEEADAVRQKMQAMLAGPQDKDAGRGPPSPSDAAAGAPRTSTAPYDKALDPEPLLKLRSEDKGLEVVDEDAFNENVVRLRLEVHVVVTRGRLTSCSSPSGARCSSWATCR